MKAAKDISVNAKIKNDEHESKSVADSEPNPEPASYEKHEVESAARTLTEAEAIKMKPKLHGHAMTHLKGQHAAMSAAMGMGSKPKDLKELRQLASKKSAIIDED